MYAPQTAVIWQGPPPPPLVPHSPVFLPASPHAPYFRHDAPQQLQQDGPGPVHEAALTGPQRLQPRPPPPPPPVPPPILQPLPLPPSPASAHWIDSLAAQLAGTFPKLPAALHMYLLCKLLSMGTRSIVPDPEGAGEGGDQITVDAAGVMTVSEVVRVSRAALDELQSHFLAGEVLTKLHSRHAILCQVQVKSLP